jgi:integrase
MSNPSPRLPKYRHYKPKNLAVVRIDEHDHYLGPYNSPESQAKYRRLVAEWLARGGTVRNGRGTKKAAEPPPLTIDEVILAFWKHAQKYYVGPEGRPTSELDNLRDALRPLRKLYGTTPAHEFGPLALRAVRDLMVRSGLARTTTNARIHRIRRIFRWAASVELLSESVVEKLRTVEGLKRGRTSARETDAVEPVPIEHVEATLPHLPPPVVALVRVQLLTGCRSGEAMAMRGCDLTPGEPIWLYRPESHKNAWRGQERVILLGPRAVEVVKPFLRSDTTAYLFRPRDAVAGHHEQRAAARRTKPTPSERARKKKSKGGHGHADRYERRSYRQAIVRACRKAGVPEWSPLQLRHTAATLIRAKFDLEAAQVVLGHATADTTQIYAERDLARARAVIAEIG